MLFVVDCYRKAKTDPPKHPDYYVDVRVSLINEKLSKRLSRNDYLERIMEPAKAEADK